VEDGSALMETLGYPSPEDGHVVPGNHMNGAANGRSVHKSKASLKVCLLVVHFWTSTRSVFVRGRCSVFVVCLRFTYVQEDDSMFDFEASWVKPLGCLLP
jgi:hypothetical protein